ncbi:MAG TPA: hypothetical protein VJ276_16025 [Thermoanaerobaculia bacterium]|nr:hypothetical protein [Thermoanaerobaculia bacterium]
MFIAALAVSGAEIPLSAPVYGPAELIQFHPQVASDGDNFLVIWNDLRGSAYTNLYATRVTASGEVLDKTNIRVADRVINATVVWTGRAYLILIQNQLGSLSVARLDRDGRLVSPAQPLNITGILYTDSQQPVASNGSRVVIGYGRQDGPNAFKRFVAVLDGEGQLLESEIPIPSEEGGSPKPLVASNGSEFLMATQAFIGDAATVSVLRLDASGHPMDSALTRVGDGRFAALSSNGSDYLVLMAAPHANSAAENTLFTRRVGRDGSLGALVTIPLSGRPDDITSLASVGNEYIGTFTVIGDSQVVVQGLRLNADGTVVAQPFAISQPGAGPSIASNGRRAFAAWVDANPAGNSDILGRLLAPTPAGDAIMLDAAAAAQRRPAGAYDGTTFLTAWEESQNDLSQPRVYIGRVTPSGVRLDGRGIRVSSTEAVQRNPHVVFDGSDFVVGWEEGDRIYLRRVTKAGQFRETTPIAVPGCYTGDFDMATDAGTTVITWLDCETRNVMAIRFDDSTASFRDAQPVVIAEVDNAVSPRIAFGFDIALVVWEERIEERVPPLEPMFQGNVRGVSFYVPQMLLLEDPFDIAATPDDEHSPAVAWDNQEFIVAYADGTGINGRYVDPFGFLLTDSRVATGPGLEQPSVVWDGVEFVVAFSGGGDVYASRVRRRSDSTVLEGKFAVAASGDFEGDPAVVLMGTGRVGFLYDRVATEPLYGGVPRVFLRLLENVAPRPRPKR